MGNIISRFRNKFSGLAVITQTLKRYRPFLSSKKSHFQNEAKCETFVVKISTLYIMAYTGKALLERGFSGVRYVKG